MTWSPSTWLGEEAPPIHSGLPRGQLGHGKRGHPKTERDQNNKAAFMLKHFFPHDAKGDLLAPPQVQHAVKGKTIEVTVTFPKGSNEESGRIWWIFDRAPDGSPKYLTEMIPDEQTMEMKKQGRSWSAKHSPEPKGQTHRFLQQPSENPAVRGIALPILPFQPVHPGRTQAPMIRPLFALAFSLCLRPAGEFFPAPNSLGRHGSATRQTRRDMGKGRRRSPGQSLAQRTGWKNQGQEWRMVHNLRSL